MSDATQKHYRHRRDKSQRPLRRTNVRRSQRPHPAPAAMSVGELAITPKISLVAVCCSRASVTPVEFLLNSRTFSMAITAWSAKVSRSAICFR